MLKKVRHWTLPAAQRRADAIAARGVAFARNRSVAHLVGEIVAQAAVSRRGGGTAWAGGRPPAVHLAPVEQHCRGSEYSYVSAALARSPHARLAATAAAADIVIFDTCCFHEPKVRTSSTALARRLRKRSPPPVLVALDWADNPFKLWDDGLRADVYLKRSRVDRRRRRFVTYHREVRPLHYPLKQAMLEQLAERPERWAPRAQREVEVSCFFKPDEN